MSDYAYYRRSSVLLNWDVIIHLASHLSRSTLISLMSTCKELRRHGVRILLGEDRAIAFWTLSDVRSLTAFMMSNIPEGTGGRSAHVRMVDLASKVQQWTHDETTLNNLVNLLKQSTNLYALSLSQHFFRYPSIAQSMCESPSPFRSLRRIRLESPSRLNLGPGATTAAAQGQVPNPATSPYFLEKLVGIPLEVIIVSAFYSRTNRAEVVQQLALFKETLQEVHIEDTHVTQGFAQGVLGSTIVFPKVRVLSMTHTSCHALPRHTDTLISVFPNVHSVAFPILPTPIGRAATAFQIHPNAPFGWQAIQFAAGENAVAPPPHTHATIREENERGQRHARWNTLTYYQGALEQLYLLAVRSQVDKLKITDFPLLASRIAWMHIVVRELAPTKLCLEVNVPDNADVELLDLMPRDVTRPLRYLEIKLLQWPEGEKLQSQLRLLCLATGTVRTLVIKVAEKVVMKYKNPRGIEASHEESEDFVIQTAQTARSLRHIGLPNDLFGPLPNVPPEEGKAWLPAKPGPKETFFWSIEHDDDGSMIYADKLSKRAAAALLEFETSPVLSSPFD